MEIIDTEKMREYFPFGLHISKKLWKRLEINSFIDHKQYRKDAQDILNIRRLAFNYNKSIAERAEYTDAIHSGVLISAGVIVDILRYILIVYCHEENSDVLSLGLKHVKSDVDETKVEACPPAFVSLYPPPDVIFNKINEDLFLQDDSKKKLRVENSFGEMILLNLTMNNPAFKPLKLLFDDNELVKETGYPAIIYKLEKFFEKQPTFEPLGATLFECLRAPMLASPDSLEGQLDYIRRRWASFLPKGLLKSITTAIDVITEENKFRGVGPGPNIPLQFGQYPFGYDPGYPEPAAYSRDADWMSNIVLMAKSTHVWLYQLSQKYNREIRLLSDIPDEELDILAGWGFTGLWLIGIWERSTASQKIKQIMGNPEAAPSAYSIYEYSIANDLGGESAYINLRDRAWQRGIRLASDMVPNHTGIHSKWVSEHPDWFIQTEQPPYPWYQFTGVDLSDDSRVTVQIEDGYWEHRDASVVFKRIDQHTGSVKYLYHGNDGTSTPWNDTAQLNFLIADAREAVIKTIVEVARRFPVIRFDAAMTLAKKHFQRLWFPKPGEGGAIPTRSEYSMTREEFDKVFPKEFWREVVDRVAEEAPDTLLLAEAFWLMEGYFVRTLGMHRVYNSAFMNMLKMEDNDQYRTTIKNVIEFSPEIAKRFVNFMNNPDEKTAVEQFGKGDKYIGIALMMVTMPGLPMFGHGQIEGFTEKYGMEYYRSYWDESVDEDLVRRHEHEIFPLMKRRKLFSGAGNFVLYDYITNDESVNENVFAYSNMTGDERALILFNNSYNSTSGSIKLSTSINIGEGDEEINLIRKTISEALCLRADDKILYRFRDYHLGLEYILHSRQITNDGVYTALGGYQYNAFIDFEEIYDADGIWSELSGRLNGQGVADLEYAKNELLHKPLHEPLRALINEELFEELKDSKIPETNRVKNKISRLFYAIKEFTGIEKDPDEYINAAFIRLKCLCYCLSSNLAEPVSSMFSQAESMKHILLSQIVIHQIIEYCEGNIENSKDNFGGELFDNWLLQPVLESCFQSNFSKIEDSDNDSLLVSVLIRNNHIIDSLISKSELRFEQSFHQNEIIGEYLGINEYKDILYFTKERFEKFIEAIFFVSVCGLDYDNIPNDILIQISNEITNAKKTAEKAEYKLDEYMQIINTDRMR